MIFPSRTGDKIVTFDSCGICDTRVHMWLGCNSKHLTTNTRNLQILSRNLRRGGRDIGICWWHPNRKGMWLELAPINRYR